MSGVEECVASVESIFGDLGARLGASATAVTAAVDVPSLSAEHVLAVAKPIAMDLLADPFILGAGFVVAPGLLDDDALLLAWWQGEDREPMPASTALERSADYRRKEWFRTPLRTGALHVTGPYIDYVCTDELVLTTTVPVASPRDRAGSAIGVMGADVLAESLEQVLVPRFRDAGATLVNHHDRIVISGDPRAFAGDQVDRGSFRQVLACDGLPLTVLA